VASPRQEERDIEERDIYDRFVATLLNTIDGHTAGDVARALGQPEQSIRQRMESSIAAVLTGLATKSNDSRALQRILDIV
jgi:hypothetical protein